VTTVLRLVTADGTVRAFEWHGDPGVGTARSALASGSADVPCGKASAMCSRGRTTLLFLLCIAIPLRRVRTLILVVTSFTLAHATTLVASAYGLAPSGGWFPPLVETLIAASIVWMALENIFDSVAGRDIEAAGGRAPSRAGGRPPRHSGWCTDSASRSRCASSSSSPARIS
jgi:hypothetical protein